MINVHIELYAFDGKADSCSDSIDTFVSNNIVPLNSMIYTHRKNVSNGSV